jgi:hypothetical protein
MFIAHYQPDHLLLDRWQDNPLIAALPRLSDVPDMMRTISNRTDFNRDRALALDMLMREADLSSLKTLYVPTVGSCGLGKRIDRMIRHGYESRNLFDIAYIKEIYSERRCLELQGGHGNNSGSALFVEGMSGIGKSRTIDILLRRYPQVIQHSEFKGRVLGETQISWLSVDAPIGGSVQGLALRLLAAYDEATGYTGTPMSLFSQYSGKGTDATLIGFAVAARSAHLGLLHLDDFQRVLEGPQKVKMIYFIISLVNLIRCPLLISATPDAWRSIRVLSGQLPSKRKLKPEDQATFEALRRLISEGKVKLERPQSPTDINFVYLTKEVLRLQWTEEKLLFTQEVCSALYNECGGITAILILLHREAQLAALSRGGISSATLEDYRNAGRTVLKDLQIALDGLRRASLLGLDSAATVKVEDEFQNRLSADVKEMGFSSLSS